MAAPGKVINPHYNFNFLVELDGISQASFRECSGLDATTEVIEHRQGGDNVTVYKLPGKTTYSNIMLKWGSTDSAELWEWRRSVIEGRVDRKNGSIVIYDLANHTEVQRWNFVKAWPTKWEGAALDAMGNEVWLQTLEIAHEGLHRA